MRIGVDLDGVLNNFHIIATKYLKQEYGYEWDETSYNIYTDLSKQQIHEFTENMAETFINEVQPIKDSRNVIVNLLNDKHQIFLITARGYEMAEDTIKWLKLHKYIFTDIYFNCGNKVDACKWKNVDLMIEDSPHNLMALAKNDIPYVVFDQSYNQDIYGELLRTNNWNEIENFIRFYSIKD